MEDRVEFKVGVYTVVYRPDLDDEFGYHVYGASYKPERDNVVLAKFQFEEDAIVMLGGDRRRSKR